MKLILSLLLLFFPALAGAQVRGDAALLSFVNYDHRGDQAIEFRTGTPPIRFGEKTMLINSVSARQLTLSGNNVPPGEDLKLTDYGANALFLTPLGRTWNFTGRLGINFGNGTSELRIKRESTFYNAALIASRSFKNNTEWKYGLGAVLVARGSIVPALAFEYESVGEVYYMQLGFPLSQATYGISKSFRVGVFANFLSGTYLLPENSPLRSSGEYIGVDRIVTGAIIRARLTSLLWLNTRVGYTVYGKTTVLNSGFDERRQLDEESGPYVLVGLAVTIPRL